MFRRANPIKAIIAQVKRALLFALKHNVPGESEKRNVIADFFVSLNRKGLLTNRETEEIIREAYEEL